MTAALFVGLGGGVGAILRYLVGLGAVQLLGKEFPWGTFIVNLVGSFFIGLLVFVSIKQEWPQNIQLLLITGLLGGFTTFSAFSYENLDLLQDGRLGLMLGNAVSSVALGVLFAWAGYGLAHRMVG